MIRTHTLALPSREELENAHLFAQLGLEKLFGRALNALIAALARHVCFADTSMLAGFVVSEAHSMTISFEGERELVEFVRDGRKHRAVVLLDSHDPQADFGSATLRGLIPTRILMRHRDKTLATRGLAWLDLDENDQDLLELVRTGLSPVVDGQAVPEHRRGECLIRDMSGNIGRGKILLPSAPARNAAIRTAGRRGGPRMTRRSGTARGWLRRVGGAAVAAPVLLVVWAPAVWAVPADGSGRLGQTPPALSWIQLTDSRGIPIWNYELSLDRGGITSPDKFFWSALTDSCWGAYRSWCALALWFLDWVLSFDWLHIVAAPLLTTGDAMQSVVNRIGAAGALLTITAVVAVVWMMRGRWATGIWELSIALVIAALASGVFASPVRMLAGENGVIAQSQQWGLALSAALADGERQRRAERRSSCARRRRGSWSTRSCASRPR